MALFSKNKDTSERDRILGQQIKDVRYRSLTEALKGEISINSKDAKISYFNFPNERQFTVISSAGKILLARDSERPVDLTSFLYWSDLSESEKSNVLMLVAGAPLNEGIISAVSVKVPSALPVLKKAIFDTTLEALKVIFDEFDSYELIDTELYKSNDVVKALVTQGIEIDTVETTIIAAQNRVEELERLLGVTVDYSYVKLSQGESTGIEVIVPEEKLVIAAADADATLADTLAISTGFRWMNILQRIYELQERKAIHVEIDAPFEALPDSFEVLHPYEKLFRLTHELPSKLDHLVASVFDLSGDIDLVNKLVNDNAILEERVLEVEDMLIRKLKGESYDTFEDLDHELQDSVRVLVLDRADANEKRLEILQRIKSLTLEDTETVADDQLRELLELKLLGIHHATDELPALEPNLEDNHFQISEEAPTFNFNDARIVQNSDGDFHVQEIVNDEAHELEDDALAIHELVSLVNNEAEPVVKPVDLAQLEDHLLSFGPTRRRKRAFRATEVIGKELDKLSD